MAASRLMKEWRAQQKDPEEDVLLFPKSDDDIYRWKGFIKGPPDTPYEDGVFELDISVPKNYPLRPPKVIFLTRVFHPNVHFKSGEICLDILKDAWSAVYTLQSVCRSIIALLSSPEADSPLNCDCGTPNARATMADQHPLTHIACARGDTQATCCVAAITEDTPPWPGCTPAYLQRLRERALPRDVADGGVDTIAWWRIKTRVETRLSSTPQWWNSDIVFKHNKAMS